MGLLKTRERSPQEEAARQAEIANEVQHQHDLEMQRQRDLTHQNARRREQLWRDQAQTAEDRRMAEAAKQLAAKREREARQRETQARLDQAEMAEFKAAEQAVKNIRAEIARLRSQPTDLSTPEGVRAAGERAGQISELEAALAKADAQLVEKGRAIGRHRAGGW